jgi:hypothetical protein
MLSHTWFLFRTFIGPLSFADGRPEDSLELSFGILSGNNFSKFQCNAVVEGEPQIQIRSTICHELISAVDICCFVLADLL